MSSPKYVLDSSAEISSNPYTVDVVKEITIRRKVVATAPPPDEFFNVLGAVIASLILLFL